MYKQKFEKIFINAVLCFYECYFVLYNRCKSFGWICV